MRDKLCVGFVIKDFNTLCKSLQEMVEMVSAEEREMAAEMAANFLNEERSESIFGAPKAGPGMWASIIRIINPISGNTLEKIQLEQNESVHR